MNHEQSTGKCTHIRMEKGKEGGREGGRANTHKEHSPSRLAVIM